MQKSYKKEIEAILFYKGEEVSLKEICSILEIDEEKAIQSINELEDDLKHSALFLVKRNQNFCLTTKGEYSKIIEKIVKDELNKDLSQASLEILSIVLYKHPVTKKEIEYIRGVNSSFSIRNLLIRGLIERESSKLDDRVYLYKPTLELMMHLGIGSFDELPEFSKIRQEIKSNMEIENKE